MTAGEKVKLSIWSRRVEGEGKVTGGWVVVHIGLELFFTLGTEVRLRWLGG